MQETLVLVDHYADFMDYKEVRVGLVSNCRSIQLILKKS